MNQDCNVEHLKKFLCTGFRVTLLIMNDAAKPDRTADLQMEDEDDSIVSNEAQEQFLSTRLIVLNYHEYNGGQQKYLGWLVPEPTPT